MELKVLPRIVRVEEGARAVVEGLAGDRRVVGVHHAVDEADAEPPRDERRLRVMTRSSSASASLPVQRRRGSDAPARAPPAFGAPRRRVARRRTGRCRHGCGSTRRA